MKYQDRTITPETMRNETDEVSLVPNMSYQDLMPAMRTDTSPKALKALESEQEYHLAVERNRAQLTYNALNLTAQLSAVEASLAETVPGAAPRLRAIVDTFTWASAVRVARM